MSEHLKHWIDWAAVCGAVATFFSWLPNIAAGLSAVWFLIRIYESRTVQRWVHGRNHP